MDERLSAWIRQLGEIREGLDDYSRELEKESGEEYTFSTPESIASAHLTMAWLSVGKAFSILESARDLLEGRSDCETEYKRLEELIYEDGQYPMKPLLYPEDVTLPLRSRITSLARIEQEELGVLRRSRGNPDYPDTAAYNRDLIITRKGIRARGDLLAHEQMQPYLHKKHPAEELKAAAAMMFFLYSQDRTRKSLSGEEPDETYYYAGENLYRYAVVMQKLEDEVENGEE